MSERDQSAEIGKSSPLPVHLPRKRRSIHSNKTNMDCSNECSSPSINLNESNQTDVDSSMTYEENSLSECATSDEVNKSEYGDTDDSDESKEKSQIVHQNNSDMKKPCGGDVPLNHDKNRNFVIYMIPVLVFVIGLFSYISTMTTEPQQIVTIKQQIVTIKDLKSEFQNQDDFLWVAIEAGVDDVITMNRPSTFILLYQPEATDTLETLLHKVAKYATCKITDCSKEPIIITNSILNSPEIVQDYGKMIPRYRNELKERGVMIIKNLENVKGQSAQAFHSFCDEFTPLVERSVFIFTMEVDKLQGDKGMQFLEEYFRDRWSDIKSDTRNALITRITSMVVDIAPLK